MTKTNISSPVSVRMGARRRKTVAGGITKILKDAAPNTGRAILFGSRARGDARADSDWDVLILLDKPRITDADMDPNLVPHPRLGMEYQ